MKCTRSQAGRRDQQQRRSKRHRGRARHGCNQKVKCTTPPPGASASSTGAGKGGAYGDGVEALRRAPRAAATEGEVHETTLPDVASSSTEVGSAGAAAPSQLPASSSPSQSEGEVHDAAVGRRDQQHRRVLAIGLHRAQRRAQFPQAARGDAHMLFRRGGAARKTREPVWALNRMNRALGAGCCCCTCMGGRPPRRRPRWRSGRLPLDLFRNQQEHKGRRQQFSRGSVRGFESHLQGRQGAGRYIGTCRSRSASIKFR